MNRRDFCLIAIAAALAPAAHAATLDVVAIDRERVIRLADRYLRERPITITAFAAPSPETVPTSSPDTPRPTSTG